MKKGVNMDSDKIKELEEIEKKYKAKNQYINNYIKNNYDRVVLLLKPGTKEKLEEKAKKLGFKSVNEYLKIQIEKELNQDQITQDFLKMCDRENPEKLPF